MNVTINPATMQTVSPPIEAGSNVVLSDLQLTFQNDLRTVFFNEKEFPESLTIQHTASGEVVAYKGIFDLPSTSVNPNTGVSINIPKPVVRVQEHLLKGKPCKGDIVTIRKQKYSIDSFENDGVGTIRIFLDLV